ncbi:MAG: hypothetical protein ABIB71_09435 [Candidatus Woesearchaeota archaeon]
MATCGKAYGFFACKASKEEIESELPDIQKFAKTPSGLELSVECVGNLKGDNDFMAVARDAKDAGLNYVLEATYQGATNKETAYQLVTPLTLTYQSELYQKGEDFQGDIVYEENGQYKFQE